MYSPADRARGEAETSPWFDPTSKPAAQTASRNRPVGLGIGGKEPGDLKTQVLIITAGSAASLPAVRFDAERGIEQIIDLTPAFRCHSSPLQPTAEPQHHGSLGAFFPIEADPKTKDHPLQVESYGKVSERVIPQIRKCHMADIPPPRLVRSRSQRWKSHAQSALPRRLGSNPDRTVRGSSDDKRCPACAKSDRGEPSSIPVTRRAAKTSERSNSAVSHISMKGFPENRRETGRMITDLLRRPNPSEEGTISPGERLAYPRNTPRPLMFKTKNDLAEAVRGKAITLLNRTTG